MAGMRFALAIAWLVFLPPGLAAAAPAIPPLTGRVVDAAHVLDDWTRNQIDGELAGFEVSSGSQLVVVTLPDLGGNTIEAWGLALGRGWGIGQKGKNYGILLVVAPKDRQLRIEVGYGLEGEMPDATANSIIQNLIVPRFRGGDMPGGILAGVNAIIIGLGGKVEGGVAAPVKLAPSRSGFADMLQGILPVLFFVAVAILLNTRRRRNGRWGTVYPYMGGGGASGRW